MRLFKNRTEAGVLLAAAMEKYIGKPGLLVLALRQQQPERTIVGVPIAAPEVYAEFRDEVDEIISQRVVADGG